jgi:Ser/Thr protein kinase RdoA (MazF antagonist)
MKIDPDKQFTTSLESIAQILSQYGLACISYKEASTGIENRTLITETDKGEFVVRIYRQGKKSLGQINLEVDFINYLRANNIKVPEILRNRLASYVTTQIFSDSTWQIIVMEFVEGVHAVSYTPTLINELAFTQANMHALAATYKSTILGRATTLNELRETYFIKQINSRQIKSQKLTNFLERGRNYKVFLDTNLPRGLCHLDYDKENTLAKDGSLAAILDFDDLEIAPYIVCLSYTLWHVRQQSGKDAANHYLSKYQSIRILSELEKSYIKPIMLFRHYVISSIKILNGHTSIGEIDEYLSIETELLSS